MLYLESGLDPETHRAGTSYYGLNQISGGSLSSAGISPASYLAWPAFEQMGRVVLPYLEGAAAHGPITTPGRLELAQLAPALLSNRSPSLVVFSAPSAEYEGNRWLDAAGKGSIVLADLESVMSSEMRRPPVVALAARAAAPASSGPSATTTAVALLLAAGAGAYLGSRA